MMILALALTVIFRIFGGGLNKIAVTGDYSRAVMIAESVLAAAGITETLQPGESSGSLFEKFRWLRTVSEYREDGDADWDRLPLKVYRVAVTVQWPSGNDNRSLDLSTLKLDVAAGSTR